MNLRNITEVAEASRKRLEPVESADILEDAVEGLLPHARKAAVLLGIFEQDGQCAILFIRRSSTLRTHSGEIAFPGGAVDPTDHSLVMTALREAQEEIGLDSARVEVLGILPPVFTVVSNYLIVPVVALIPEGLGTLQLQASEVTEIILTPLHGLTDATIFHTEEWMRSGRAHTVYFYNYGPYRIWGATARILNSFLALLASSDGK